MAVEHLHSDQLNKSSAPLSNAVKVGGLIFVSGIPAFAPDGSLARGDFPAQMRQVMANIKVILEDAGSSFDRIAKMTVILARISDVATMNRMYREYFPDGRYPARTTIEAALPNPDFLLEIECVAEA